MPRSARLDASGILHHVMGRGIEKGAIFLDAKDREDFIARLAALAESKAITVYAWALLPPRVYVKFIRYDWVSYDQGIAGVRSWKHGRHFRG